MTDLKVEDGDLHAALAGLPAYDASPERVARVRARCLAAIATKKKGETAVLRFESAALLGHRVEVAAALILGLSFLTEAALQIVAVFLA